MISVGRGRQRRALVVFLGWAVIPALPLAAQEAPTNNSAPAATRPSDVIGPEQLRNFSLGAKPPVDPDQAVSPDLIAPRANRPTTRPATRPATAANPPPATTRAPVAQAPAPAARAPEPRPQPAPVERAAPAPPTNSVTVAMPQANPLSRTPTPATDSVTPRLSSQPLGPNAPLVFAGDGGDDPSLLPWIIALLMLAGAAVYYALRSRRRAPEPAVAGPALVLPRELEPRSFPPAPPPAPFPAPSPAPEVRHPALVGGITVKRPDAFARTPPAAPPAAPRPKSTGIVSTRLRPQLEIEFEPGRAVIDEGQASVHFDVVVTNSGSAPARHLLVEACMINAGPEQDSELRRFFDAPVGQGDRIDSIPPLGRVSLKSAVALPLDQVRAYEVGGRKLFVPLVAFNALYEWGSGQGQSSAAFILGRSSGAGDVDGESEARMAPLRLDLGPRTFSGLEGRRHPLGLKR